MNAVDTNVMIYLHDPRDRTKQAEAEMLIKSLTDGVLLWQVACEYVAAIRKLAPLGLRTEDAFARLRDLRETWSFALPDWATLERARHFVSAASLSFWDALLVSACVDGGVRPNGRFLPAVRTIGNTQEAP